MIMQMLLSDTPWKWEYGFHVQEEPTLNTKLNKYKKHLQIQLMAIIVGAKTQAGNFVSILHDGKSQCHHFSSSYEIDMRKREDRQVKYHLSPGLFDESLRLWASLCNIGAYW